MENKAQITIYDDLTIIDETETYFKDNEQLAGIATSCLRSTPNAELVEVYVGNKLKMKFRITSRGKIKKESLHPGWGGARTGAGRKKKGTEQLSHIIHFRISSSDFDFINAMDSLKKGDWLRQAITEKRERETQ